MWAVENWKSKTRIPTFPPPRLACGARKKAVYTKRLTRPVEDALVVELKCAERLASEHTAQCLNYLRASGRTVCLLVNFQKPKVEWKRVVLGFSDGLKAPGDHE